MIREKNKKKEEKKEREGGKGRKSTGTSQPGRKRQIPRQTRPVVQILRIKLLPREPIPHADGIDEREVGIQHAPPPARYPVDGIDARRAEIRIPLLRHKAGGADVGGRRVDGQHVDALNVVVRGAEVGRVVDFILEQDARVLVGQEVGRLVGVGGAEEKVGVEGAALDGEHEGAARLRGGVAGDEAPESEGVAEEGVFRGGFLVLAVAAVEEALGPRVSVVPVEAARDGEVWVVRGWVAGVPDEGVDPVLVGGQPGWIEVGDDAGGVDEVRPVEVVIVVVRVSEIVSTVSSHV